MEFEFKNQLLIFQGGSVNASGGTRSVDDSLEKQKKINVWIYSSAAVWDLVNGSETGSGVGRDCRLNASDRIMIGMLENARKKLESKAMPQDGSKSEVKVKKEEDTSASVATPSPKKMATEYEKKMKNMEGDLRLVKAGDRGDLLSFNLPSINQCVVLTFFEW